MDNHQTETFGRALLAHAAKSGDAANAKVAKKALENADKVGVTAAYRQMGKDCFKHPDHDGRQLSYSEMRSYYC